MRTLIAGSFQGNRTILTVMMGGAWADSVLKDKTQEKKILETSELPIFLPDVANNLPWKGCLFYFFA